MCKVNTEEPYQSRSAAADRIARLYHWRRFDEIRLRAFLADNKIYAAIHRPSMTRGIASLISIRKYSMIRRSGKTMRVGTSIYVIDTTAT
jgi:hypothetical protein